MHRISTAVLSKWLTVVSSRANDGVSNDSWSEVSGDVYHRRPLRCLTSTVRTYNISGRRRWVKWTMLAVYVAFVSMEWFTNLFQRYRALTLSLIYWTQSNANWTLSCFLCYHTRAEHWQLCGWKRSFGLISLAILCFVNGLRHYLFNHLDVLFTHHKH